LQERAQHEQVEGGGQQEGEDELDDVEHGGRRVHALQAKGVEGNGVLEGIGCWKGWGGVGWGKEEEPKAGGGQWQLMCAASMVGESKRCKLCAASMTTNAGQTATD
jgi:hypothetical protein